jgi:hypothetical protein
MPSALPRRDGTLSPVGSPRYDELFRGGVFASIIGVGFDEDGANREPYADPEPGLLARGFARNDAAALTLLTASGRPAPRHPMPHFVRTTGDVKAVVTLARAGDGTEGALAASAFLDGMNRCDLAQYAGHGRYGTGPDFDYNFTADLVDAKGVVTASFRAYKDLEEHLTELGAAKGQSARKVYEDLRAKRRLVVRRINGGNLVINLRNYHAGELGARFMVDQLATDPAVRRMSQQRFDKRYRVWAFHGCRTHDYLLNLRTMNPEANAGGLDLVATRRVCYWTDLIPSALTLIDGLLLRKDFTTMLGDLAAVNRHPGLEGADTPSHVADLSPRR